MRSVERGAREAVQGLQEFFALELARLGEGASLDHLCQARSGSNRGDAAADAVAHLIYSAVRDLYCQVHDVAADGVFHARLGVRAGEVADVAGVLEVVEDFFGIEHSAISHGGPAARICNFYILICAIRAYDKSLKIKKPQLQA